MPRPALTPEKKAKMRGEIREALVRIIRRRNITPGDVRGYASITIRDVIEEANISIGTFYKYFKNRAELGQSLWAEPVSKLKLDMQSDYDSAENPIDKIRVLLGGYVKFAIENPRVFKAAFLFIRPEGDPKPELLNLKHEMLYQNLRDAFEEGQSSGIFKSFDTHEMAQLFWSAIHGSLALPENIDRYDFDNPEKMTGTMIEALLGMIAAP